MIGWWLAASLFLGLAGCAFLLRRMITRYLELKETHNEIMAAGAALTEKFNQPETLAKQYAKLMADQGYPHTLLLSADLAPEQEGSYRRAESCISLAFDDKKTQLALALYGTHMIANGISPCRTAVTFEDGQTLSVDPNQT